MLTRDVIHIAPIPGNDVKHQLYALEDSARLKATVGILVSDSGAIHRFVKLINGAEGSYSRKLRNRLVPKSIGRRTVSPLTSLVVSRISHRGGNATSQAKFDRELSTYDRRAERLLDNSIRAIVGREDCCEAAFTKAQSLGIARLYDLPTLYCDAVRSILEKELQEFPEAEPGLRAGDVFSAERCERKQREIMLASHVLVASELVRKSAESVIPRDRIVVLPYGFDEIDTKTQFVPARDRIPQLIFGGNVTLRKGIPRLLRAWKRLAAHRTHRLKLFGGMSLSRRFLADYQGLFENIPRVPRTVLQDEMRHSKALVMPSIADGFGLIVSEALSVGTPVVVSNNTGSAEMIQDGLHGYRYEYDDDEAFCTALEKVLVCSHDADEMSEACLELARSYTWADYRAKFSELVQSATA